jgi:hypothetical protein
MWHPSHSFGQTLSHLDFVLAHLHEVPAVAMFWRLIRINEKAQRGCGPAYPCSGAAITARVHKDNPTGFEPALEIYWQK